MTLSGYKFWGAYSNVPLLVSLSEDEEKTLKESFNPEIFIKVDFNIYKEVGFEEKSITFKKSYVSGNYITVDLTAIFKSLSFLYGDINRGTDIGSFSSNDVKITAYAQYYNNNREAIILLDSQSEKTFKIRPSNFSIYSIFKEANGVRLCKRFYDFALKINKPYTTFFKGFTQKDFIIKAKDNFESEFDRVDRNENSPYVDRVVDECGIFVTWLNEAGTWSYWLFSEKYTEEIKTKSMGTIQKNKINEQYISGMHSLGYTAYKRWTLRSDVPVMDGELEELQSIYSSSIVFVYLNGKGGGGNNFVPVRVSVVEGSYKFDINKQDVYPFNVTIEFEPLALRTEL